MREAEFRNKDDEQTGENSYVRKYKTNENVEYKVQEKLLNIEKCK